MACDNHSISCLVKRISRLVSQYSSEFSHEKLSFIVFKKKNMVDLSIVFCVSLPGRVNLHFPMGFPMIFPLSYGFPMVFLWFSYGFPMVFLWFSYGFPTVDSTRPGGLNC